MTLGWFLEVRYSWLMKVPRRIFFSPAPLSRRPRCSLGSPHTRCAATANAPDIATPTQASQRPTNKSQGRTLYSSLSGPSNPSVGPDPVEGGIFTKWSSKSIPLNRQTNQDFMQDGTFL